MNIHEGATVSIEGSDTLWLVTEVNKQTCNLIDALMGIIELDEVPITEVLGVLSEDEVA